MYPADLILCSDILASIDEYLGNVCVKTFEKSSKRMDDPYKLLLQFYNTLTTQQEYKISGDVERDREVILLNSRQSYQLLRILLMIDKSERPDEILKTSVKNLKDKFNPAFYEACFKLAEVYSKKLSYVFYSLANDCKPEYLNDIALAFKLWGGWFMQPTLDAMRSHPEKIDIANKYISKCISWYVTHSIIDYNREKLRRNSLFTLVIYPPRDRINSAIAKINYVYQYPDLAKTLIGVFNFLEKEKLDHVDNINLIGQRPFEAAALATQMVSDKGSADILKFIREANLDNEEKSEEKADNAIRSLPRQIQPETIKRSQSFSR